MLLASAVAMARRFRKSDSFALIAGTACAQTLGFLSLLAIGRLYSQEDMGIFTGFMAAANIIVVIAGLRLHLAIPIPADELEACHVAVSAFVVSIVSSVITAVSVLLVPHAVVAMTPFKSAESVLLLLPLAVLGPAALTIVQFWHIRRRSFGKIAHLQILQATTTAGLQITLGLAGMDAHGLIIGQVVGGYIGLTGGLLKELKGHAQLWRNVSWHGVLKALRTQKRFLKYSAIEALANTAGSQGPLIIIAQQCGSSTVGTLAMAMRLLMTPTGLLSTVFAQTLYPKIVARAQQRELGRFIGASMRQIALFTSLPILSIVIFAPAISSSFLGAAWADTAAPIRWLGPVAILTLATSPVSPVLHVLNAHRAAMILQIFGLLLRVSIVAALSSIPIEAFALGNFVFYLVYAITILSIVRSLNRRALQ